VAGVDDDLRLRVADLELAVSALRAEVARLSPREGAPGPPAPATAAPARSAVPPTGSARKPGADLERVVGRYGALALATLTTLAAVATFVSWAAARGLLGPTTRVVLGLALAAALAGTGLRLRRRERAFGSALLALALAVVHVCAWAAGPELHLVGDSAAFALAAAGSVGLAAFALAEREAPLWSIGFAGAALAPFVTMQHAGSLVMLAAYGALVIVAGAAGIGGRRWILAERTLALMTAVYALMLALPAPAPSWGPLLAVAVPLTVALAGLVPATELALVRPRLRTQGVIAGFAALWAGARAAPLAAGRVSVLLGVGGLVWLLLTDRTSRAPLVRQGAQRDDMLAASWVDGFVVPLLFVAAAAYGARGGLWSTPAVLAIAALALGAALSRRDAVPERDALVLAAAAAALAASALAPWRSPIGRPVTDAALGLAFAAALRWRPSYSWLVAGTVALVAAASNTWILMFERAPFAYVPFASRPSLAALVVVAALAAVAWRADALATALVDAVPDHAARAERDAPVVRRWMRSAPWIWAFVWVHRELAGAWAYAVSTLALVSYEAAVAVILVGLGRARDVRRMRQAGLLLAVIAAVRALVAVDGVRSVSLRIASYLVASVFLLGIAYWYRRRGADPAPGEAEPARPPQM
jgi:hypothetical protein